MDYTKDDVMNYAQIISNYINRNTFAYKFIRRFEDDPFNDFNFCNDVIEELIIRNIITYRITQYSFLFVPEYTATSDLLSLVVNAMTANALVSNSIVLDAQLKQSPSFSEKVSEIFDDHKRLFSIVYHEIYADAYKDAVSAIIQTTDTVETDNEDSDENENEEEFDFILAPYDPNRFS